MRKNFLYSIVTILLFSLGIFVLSDAQGRRPFLLKLNELQNVSTATPTNGQVLAYVSATGLWTPGAAAGGGDMLQATYDPDTDSKIDISANTNFAIEANELTLTGDSVGLA